MWQGSCSLYGLQLIFNSNIWPNSAPVQDIRLLNVGDLVCDLSKSLKVKSNGAVELPIYGFLLMFNGKLWLPSWDIRLQNLNDLDCDLSRPNVKVSLESPYKFIYGVALTDIFVVHIWGSIDLVFLKVILGHPLYLLVLGINVCKIYKCYCCL